METYFYYLTHCSVTEPQFKIALKTAYVSILNNARFYLLEHPEHDKRALNRIVTELKRRHKKEFNTKLEEEFMNKVFLIGNLTRDPELTETANGVSICRFSIAVNRSYKTPAGEQKTDFFNCTAWRSLGENIARYVHKGDKVAVSGSVELRNYEDNEGAKRLSVDIIARDVEFLSSKASASEEDKKPSLQSFDDDGDIPF